MRQCPNRYAFRAGQNLPDKEFRYLWTIIVIAAVHWGFNSLLRCYRLSSILQIILTFQHWAGVSSYTSAYALAETYVFVKQSLGPIFCVSLTGALFIPKLQSNFAEFLNKNYLARLWILSSPTCVRLRYGHHKIHLETFLGSVASPDLRRHTSRFCYADLPT